jgi:flagellar biosynthesis component FlhA
MDGASKFVRGDAMAGLIILAVNLLGGFFVGVMQRGWPLLMRRSSTVCSASVTAW